MVDRRPLLTRTMCAGLAAAAALAVAPAAMASAGSAEFDRLVAEAKGAMMRDPDAALRESGAALAEARRHPDNAIQLATARWLQGEALLRLNRLEAAEPAIREGLALAAAKAPNTKLHGDLTRALGAVQATRGEIQPALAAFQSALKIFAAAREPRSQAIALQDIGTIYQDAGDYQKVLQYYAQSAEVFQGDEALLLSAHNNVGNALKELRKYDEASTEFSKALAIARRMKSAYFEAWVLDNLAATEVLAGRLAAADQHLAAGLAIAQADPSAHELTPYFWAIQAQAAQARGQSAQAARLLERTFAGQDLAKTTLPFRDFHRTAYEVYEGLGDTPRALTHLKAYKRLDDEARALSASTNAALMAAQFDFANQSSRIARLKATQLQKDVELARTRDLITRVLLAASVMIGGLLAAGFVYYRRARNTLARVNGQLNIANVELERALTVRNEFLATTSHEIRTPLNGILGMTEVILRDQKLEPALREKLSVVHGAGETMRALVDDILDVAKIETGKLAISPVEMNLTQLFDDTARLWTERAAAKGLTLDFDVAAAPARIVEDGSRLRQVLFNLLSNAIKFTEAGAVGLTAEVETSDDFEELVLKVRDSGIGIPSDKLAEIFESFRQVDGSITRIYGGTGLGLTICKSLVEAMGGIIIVDSILGEGSTFTIRLPLTRAGDDAPAETFAAETFEESRLVLADGNPLSQALVRAVLQPKVRTLETALSVDQTIAACAAQGFDLVLADAAVLGEDAAARPIAARALAEAIAPAALVVMAAGVTDEEIGAYLRAGAAQLIKKPIAAPALVTELKSGFEGRRAQAQLRVSAG